jgi:lysosomal acid lipase/cholesteryl ester hydrolase
LILDRGYPCEEHYVVTRDGFVLNLQRIPDGRKKDYWTKNTLPHSSNSKPVVFLQHGILADATNWVLDYPSLSLGYILADSGFDVWLGNVRGNDYSRRNSRYGPSKEEFWDWR